MTEQQTNEQQTNEEWRYVVGTNNRYDERPIVFPAGRKDAFHFPCVLVACDLIVFPGDNVKLVAPDKVVLSSRANRSGIVDPFLSEAVTPKLFFWLLLDPGLVSDLTHSFEIKGVPAPPPESVPFDYGAYDDAADLTRCRREGCS
jgi:hypothetical protein